MRVALDATYSVDSQPSGIAVYSQHLLHGLATHYPDSKFIYCYRLKQFFRAPSAELPNASKAMLLPPLPTFRSEIFHALNQRVDQRRTKRVVSTFHDLFVMTAEYSSQSFRERFAHQAREAASRSDLLIAVSEFTAGQSLPPPEHRTLSDPSDSPRSHEAGEAAHKRARGNRLIYRRLAGSEKCHSARGGI